jgi:hypothetical protein
MAINTEQRIKALEDELKALKATYTVYGGLVKSYITTFSWTNNSGEIRPLKVRFRPDYGNGKTMIFGFYYSGVRNGVVEPLDDGFLSIQDGSGDVFINMGRIYDGTTVNLTLLTPMTGKLTRIS